MIQVPKKGSESLLALDAGSPVVSVAVGPAGHPVAERSIEIRQSSERLVALVDECLEEAGVAMAELAGILALRGPGSFTGLRVGLATTLGFHQALGIPATAVPTLDALALHGARRLRDGGRDEPVTIAAVVDALRGEWFTQLFRVAPGEAPRAVATVGDSSGPAILDPAGVAALAPDAVSGFGAGRLAASLAGEDGWRAEVLEPAPLAPDLLRLAALAPLAWRPATLVAPVYLRAPAVSLPKRKPCGAGPPPRTE
jgi:tRNA threonylcarbamoyl adenosine modification protein YeaZ